MTKILLIGEAYGRTENEYNHGFTGSSGIELAQMLHEANITHNFNLFCKKCQTWSQFPQCHICTEPLYPSAQDMIRHWHEIKTQFQIEITNVFNLHPENNDLGEFFEPIKNSFLPGYKYHQKRPISYLKEKYQNHLHILWERIQTTQPNITILLGNTACWAVLRQTNITAIRGTIIPSNYLPGKYLATYHPANILREWPNRPIAIADFKKAHNDCEFKEIRRPKRKAAWGLTLEEITNWINLPAETYTVDIESGYVLYSDSELKSMPIGMKYILSSQISMVSLARNPYDAIVIEFMTRNKPNLSYWNTKEEEIKAWNLLQFALDKPIPKTFQNGTYDITRLLYATIKARYARDDTMLKQHARYPEMRKSLGFLASIYCNDQPWKLMYAKGENLKRDE